MFYKYISAAVSYKEYFPQALQIVKYSYIGEKKNPKSYLKTVCKDLYHKTTSLCKLLNDHARVNSSSKL